MRFAAPAIALAFVLVTVSSVSHGKRVRDDEINPRAKAMTDMALKDFAAGKFEAAQDGLESSLVIDPKNRMAYIGLARIALKQDLPGKAIRLYREALVIDPNDVVALAGQGEALATKGALTKARENMARIERLCSTSCPEIVTLNAAIAKGQKTADAAKTIPAEALASKTDVTDLPAADKAPEKK